MLTSLDFFYPLHDDPFTQGQITICNVLSDIYASGVTNIDHFLVVLGLSTEMSQEQREKAMLGIMKGMENKLNEADTVIAGGQTVFNPWVMTGGSVTGFHDSKSGFDLFTNRDCQPGDVLVLTKPLGSQMVINFAQYLRKSNESKLKNISDCGWINKIEGIRNHLNFFDEDFIKSFSAIGFDYMKDLNLYASLCMQNQMRKKEVKACTDVTGFGLRGHAENLVKIQNMEVDFVFDKIVTLDKLDLVDQIKNNHVRDFGLMEGYMPESSGGLLMIMSQESSQAFLKEFETDYERKAWVVGRVVEGQRKVIWNKQNLHVEYG